MPCSDEDGAIVFETNSFAKEYGIKNCPFREACEKNGNKNLAPPKSISIWGQTGWTNAYAKKESGGGGLMA